MSSNVAAGGTAGSAAVVLLRHGRTPWSAQGRLTGWEDPPLDSVGEDEARRAALALAASGAVVGAVLSSTARRALRTAEHVVDLAGLAGCPTASDWRLNERHLGQLQGLDRATARARFGKAQVRSWVHDRSAVPPKVPRSDRRHPAHDRRYQGMDPELLPGGESLDEVRQRVIECWSERGEPLRRAGVGLLVVGHCHALRELARHLGAADASSDFAVTGSGLIFEHDLAPVPLVPSPPGVKPVGGSNGARDALFIAPGGS